MLGVCSPCCPKEPMCGQCCPDKPTQIVFSVQSEEVTGDPRQAPDEPLVEESVTCPAIDEEVILDIEQVVVDREIDEYTFDGATTEVSLTVDGQPLVGPCRYELWLNGAKLTPPLTVQGSFYVQPIAGEPVTMSFTPAPAQGTILRGIVRGTCAVVLSHFEESTEFVVAGTATTMARSWPSEAIGGSATLHGFFGNTCTPAGCLRVSISEEWKGSGLRLVDPLSEVCTDDAGEDCNMYASVTDYVSLSHPREEPTVTARMNSIAGTGAELEVTLTEEDGDECLEDSGVFKTYWKASAKVKEVDGKKVGGEYYLPTDRVVFETDDIGGPVLSSTNPLKIGGVPDLPAVNYTAIQPEITLLARSGEGAVLTPVLAANTGESDTYRIDAVTVEEGGNGYLEGDQVFVECDYRAIVPSPAGVPPRGRHPDLRVRIADLEPPAITIEPFDTDKYPCLDDVTLTHKVTEVPPFEFYAAQEWPRQYILEFEEMLALPRTVVATCPNVAAGTRVPIRITLSDGAILGDGGRYWIEFDKSGKGTVNGAIFSTRIQPTQRGAVGSVVNTSKGSLVGGGFYRKLTVESVDGQYGQFYKLGSPASCAGYESWSPIEKSGGPDVGGNYTTQHVNGSNGPSFYPSLKRVCPTPTVTVTIQ